MARHAAGFSAAYPAAVSWLRRPRSRRFFLHMAGRGGARVIAAARPKALGPPVGDPSALEPCGAVAPARPARPSSQTGRRRAGVRPAMPGDGIPALRRPGPEAWPVPACACGGDDRVAGDAGVRAWGRWGTPGGALGPARAPVPHPASRTPRPSEQPRAPARGTSAFAGGRWSSGGTCVRQTTNGVGRNAHVAGFRDPAATNLALDRGMNPQIAASDLAICGQRETAQERLAAHAAPRTT